MLDESVPASLGAKLNGTLVAILVAALTASLPAADAIATHIIDRQIDEMTLRFRRRSIERRLGSDPFRPNGLQDRLEDRQRHARPGRTGAERAALAVAI